MNFEQIFPLRYYLNLGYREDRRVELEWHMDQVGITADRFPAIDARFKARLKKLGNSRTRAQSLSHREAIRRAKLQNSPGVLLFEDDIIFHPNIRQLIDRINLPGDWGIFHLGCRHVLKPEPIGEGIVRVKEAKDTHAWAIHQRYYDRVLAVLDCQSQITSDGKSCLDRALAILHQEIPSYSCYPNLVWPYRVGKSGKITQSTFYGKTGLQSDDSKVLNNLLTSQIAPEILRQAPKLALLFLTRGDVHCPQIWRDWVSQSPLDVSVYCHPKNPSELVGGFLEGTAIEESHDTEWGQVSLVKATLALIKEALKDPSLTHFALLSESCVPIQPLKRILFRLQHDGRPRFNSRDQDQASLEFQSRMFQAPDIPVGCWRFHQQWWLLDRTAAKMASRTDHTDKFDKVFASDEGYFGTTLMLEGYPVDDLIDDRPITWTHWEPDAASPTEFSTLPADRLRDLINSDCFFGRKFPQDADIGEYELHK